MTRQKFNSILLAQGKDVFKQGERHTYGLNEGYGVINDGRGLMLFKTQTIERRPEYENSWEPSLIIAGDPVNRIDEWFSLTVPEMVDITKVIFNPPATIVFWTDGDKTVVKCNEEEDFDPEKGLAMAICKKVLGDGYFRKMKKWIEPWEKEETVTAPLGKLVADVHTTNAVNDWAESMRRLFGLEVGP